MRFELRRLVLSLFLLPQASSLKPQASEAEQVEALLSRLGLTELRIRHLEKEVAKAATPDERLPMARRLADVYAERMMAVADDRERYADLQKRVEALLATTPGASTVGLQIVLLQADYQRAESLVIAWLDDPGQLALRDEAHKILASIAPQLQVRRESQASEVEKAAARLDALESDAAQAAAEPELARQQAIVARTAYFTGWAHYYLGITRQNVTAAQGDFKTAEAAFCDVLSVSGEKDFTDVEVDSLGLESVWRARAVIGLALSETALDRLPAAQRCFSWLQHVSAPPALREQAAYWQLQGLLNAERFAEAVELAKGQLNLFSGAASPGKNSFCIALVRAALAGDGPKRDESAELAELGIRGLARLRQYDLLDQLFTKYKVNIDGPSAGFYLTWLHGRQQFLRAEKSQAAADYQATVPTLARALTLPDAQTDLSAAGQCRYCLAWCRYRLGEHAAAAREFHEAAAALKKSYAEMAEQAAWMECVARQMLATQDKQQTAAAITALQNFKLSYPQSAQSPKAELLIAKLQGSGAGGAALAEQSLAGIKPGDANYAAAQFELCLLRYREWSAAKASPQQSPALSAATLAAVARYQAAAGDADWERKLRSALLALEVLAADGSTDSRLLFQQNSLAAAAAEHLPASHALLPEFHYRRLQAAQARGDATAVQEAAQWLTQHGAGSAYELSALVITARAADQALAATTGAARAEKLAAAVKLYQRLATLLGEMPEAIGSVKNALAVNSRLAQYEEELGNWSAASDRLERIVAAYPSDRKYLRRAALASFKAGKFDRSLEGWRKLLDGLESGSNDWLEAKLYQMDCLARTDRATAQKVWKQFQLLFPEVPAPWRERFAELRTRLEA